MTAAKLVCIGETMGLLTSSMTGPAELGAKMRLSFGGAESNVAIAARRLGVSSAWVSRLGDDQVGDLILRQLRCEGVLTSVVRDQSPTGLMIKTSRVGNLRRIDYHRTGSAASFLSPADIDLNIRLIALADIIHISGITPALGPNSLSAVQHAIAVAKAHGAAVSFDVNFRHRLWSPHLASPILRELASQCDYVFATEEEIELMTGISDFARAADDVLALGPTQVIIKRGHLGCAAFTAQGSIELAAVNVPVLDPVGAGDAFVAGFLVGVLENFSLRDSLSLANTVGAFAVATNGDWEGLPNRDELSMLTTKSDNVTR